MKKTNAFSFIEMLIVILVVGILTVVAVSVYSSFALKARRADGINALLSISMAQERYRASNSTYGTLAQVYGGASTSPQGYYNLAVSSVSATGFTATATGIGGQANDTQGTTNCGTLTLSVSNNTITQTPAECWPS